MSHNINFLSFALTQQKSIHEQVKKIRYVRYSAMIPKAEKVKSTVEINYEHSSKNFKNELTANIPLKRIIRPCCESDNFKKYCINSSERYCIY